MMIPMVAAKFNGDGTFYGAGGHGELGACMLSRGFNGVINTVAINKDQWNDGAVCGKCLMIQPSDKGIGTTPINSTIFATIDNLCPECHYGDVDIGMSGDGRWQITWDFIACH